MIGVVLISGSGSNLQSLIDESKNINLEISCVISNNPDAYGLERAKKANIETKILDHNEFSSRESYDNSLKEIIEKFNPEVIILAGFMRILTANFVNHFLGRVLNIHPSLLPKYPGLHTHQRAIDAGDKVHGVSVHFVTPELDGGPIIAQKKIEVYLDDDADSLSKRLLKEEHIIYPGVVQWFAQGRLMLKDNMAYLDKKLICLD